MKILMIGCGGREHVLVAGLAKSADVTDIWCAPGNPGMAEETLANGKKVVWVPIPITDTLGLRRFAKERAVDLTVIGPEGPLCEGITDIFEVAGLTVFGPNKAAARFEGSKCFAQEFARRHKLPFAPGECFNDLHEAKAYARSLGGRCVVKADGLCGGKGSFPCQAVAEADVAIENLLLKRQLGPAGDRIVIQEWLDGFELSLHILCDGTSWKLLPAAQDHKRLCPGNQGPQTGGMGAYSPYPYLSLQEIEKVAESIMKPFLQGCRREGVVFRGLLYPGIMMTKSGPKILEFNVRFGDPETQVIVPRLENDLAGLLLATAQEELCSVPLKVKYDRSAVCVVIAAPGYPAKPVLGKKIEGLDNLRGLWDVKIFHAGTRLLGSDLVTAGGRILGVTAWGSDLKYATRAAYAAAKLVRIDGGSQMRPDIAGGPC
ncbi:MAG: phosphoribosylamine--glycine ligase [Candidatus Taylorbacteria bacterium]|nr:phosphoribosylamine--glycine ligase [Candidatus Taylorbacteria bacterium]